MVWKLNSDDDIAGYFFDRNNARRGLLLSSGRLAILDDPKAGHDHRGVEWKRQRLLGASAAARE